MDDRIFDLVKRAKFAPWALHGPKNGNIRTELETLSTLLVQECAGLFDATSDSKTMTHKQIVTKIKNHFGMLE